MTLRYVSNTSVQNLISSSVGSFVPRQSHHQSGNPCSLAHSVGVSLRTLYRSIERLEADHRVRLAYRGLMVPEAEMKRIVAHFSSNGVPGSLEK